MRLNRKWLYLGGLIAMLTLLLTLTWVLPAGAVGTLDSGALTTDKDYVSPDPEIIGTPHPREVEVTLTNADLDSTQSVREGGDFGPVTIGIGAGATAALDAVQNGSFRVSLRSLLDQTDRTQFPTSGFRATIPPGSGDRTIGTDEVLPIVGSVSIDADETGRTVRNALGSPVVINATDGLIEFPLLKTLTGTNDAPLSIVLSYDTSNQETALVNVRGDNDDFDLLLVESTKTPGEYSGTFMVSDLPAVTVDTADAVIDEQHMIPSGLEGYREFRNESLTEFYTEYKPLTGTLTDDPDDTFADRLASPAGTAEGSTNGIAGDPGDTGTHVFYARVANPPLRDGRDTDLVDPDSDDPTGSGDDVSVEVVTGVTVTVENANQGILKFVLQDATFGDGVTGNDSPFTGFSGGSIDVDYFGSDSFTITVDHGPIRLPDDANDNLDDQNASDALDMLVTTDSEDIKIVLPTTEQDKNIDADGIKASDNLAIVSVSDDSNCEQCVVRLGVITGGQARSASDGDPDPLEDRFSVLAISYFGSERVYFTAPAVGEKNIDDLDDEISTNPQTDQAMVEFKVTLDAPLADSVPDTMAFDHGIAVISASSSVTASPTVVTTGDKAPRKGSRDVWFSIDPDDLTIRTTPDEEEDDSEIVESTDFFDVTYSRQVGALSRNALDPDADTSAQRPVIAVSPGSRVRITSADEAINVDAEEKGPSFSNPSPANSAGTGSVSETIVIDVTDDLAGVNEKRITLKVKAGSRRTMTVVNRDLDIIEIENGYRVSIDLDDVRHDGKGTKLRVDETQTTTVTWYAEAFDMAGNMDRSDSNSEKKDAQNYTFNVDGESATLQRAYTGDWFDISEGKDGRVKGDRRVSRDNYLPGVSLDTSIRVVFSEPLDGTTVSADDFTVDGAVPTDANWYGKGLTDGVLTAGANKGNDEKDTANDGIGRSVFLTVPAMAADATPAVVLLGSVSDKAGNATTSGSKTATDGIAPSATVSVDTTLSQEEVTVTVTTNERIRTQYPELKFSISDALDKDDDLLDETDTFEVGLQDPEEDEEDVSSTSNPLVLRDASGGIVSSANLEDAEADELNLTLSQAPILDKNMAMRDGKVDRADIDVVLVQKDAANPKPIVMEPENAIVDAAAGKIKLTIAAPDADASPPVGTLQDGDKIVVTYRGTGPDPANHLTGVPENPAGTRVSGEQNTWTYELKLSRNDRFAVVANAEDVNRNLGKGGNPDPKNAGATVFEIDSNLAGTPTGVVDATSAPENDPAGAHPVAFDDPFTIDLSWPAEKAEYPGDSNPGVTLTKLELDGADVMASAAKQDPNSYSIDISAISLGAHTLTYNAEDAAGNAYPKDRSLKFTVKERPTWDLQLRKGMNLISLPSNPSNGSIDAVFGGAAEVDLVFTFEGAQSLVAVRNPGTGGFAGTLTSIDSRHAYWVSVTNATKVEIVIPPTSAFQPLPNIAVKGGAWNLVPVLTLGSIDSDTAGQGAKPGTLMDADAYLGDFQIAFGWQGGRWMRIDPDPADVADTAADDKRLVNDIRVAEGKTAAEEGDDPLKVGMGYWVLYTKDSFIVPR